jgi:Protein of unknown function (DUF2510)
VPWVSGWYPDPTGRFEYRYHNGTAWTADVSTGGRRFVDALAQPAPPFASGPTGGPVGAVGRTPTPVGVGNGIALAGMVCGIVSLVIGWVPFIGLLGIVAAIVGLSLSIPGLARAKETGERRSFAITGIITSVIGLVVGALGIVFAVVLFRAVQRFDSPGAHDARLVSCAAEDGYLVAKGEITNNSSRERDYTILVRLESGERHRIEVDNVAPQATAPFTARSDASESVTGEGNCAIVEVNGPIPFDLDPDLFD